MSSALFDEVEQALQAFRDRWEAHSAFVAAGGKYLQEDPVGVPRGFGPPEDGGRVDPDQHRDRVRHPDHKILVDAVLRNVEDELRSLLVTIQTFTGRVPEVP